MREFAKSVDKQLTPFCRIEISDSNGLGRLQVPNIAGRNFVARATLSIGLPA